jgi:DNA-binding MarR family transcriptional regulator
MSVETNDDTLDYGILPNLIGYRLRRAQIKFFESFAKNFDEFDITPGLFAIIELVNKNPGLSQSTIAAALQNDRSTMVHAVDKLEKMNIIKREPSPTDRRSNVLYMTAQGQIVYEALVARALKHEMEFLPVLEEGEKEHLLSILDRFSKV